MLATAMTAEAAGDYQINVTCSEGGTLSLNKASLTANAGDLVKVFAHPDNDTWQFQSLTIVRDDNGQAVSYSDYYDANYQGFSFTMPQANVSISATFVKVSFAVTVSNPVEGGKATVDVENGATGTEVTVTVSPNAGYKTVNVTALEQTTGNELTVTKVSDNVYSFILGDDDVLVTPAFEALRMINVQTSGDENGSLNVDETAYPGEVVYFYTVPAPGYTVDLLVVKEYISYTENSNVEFTKLGENSYTFVMPDCEWVTIFASFKKKDYFVRVADGIEHGTVSESTPGAAHHHGDVVTMNIAPDTDYALKLLTLTDETGNDLEYTWLTQGSSFSFTMPYGDVNVNASFSRTVYGIEILDSELGSVTSDVSEARVGETVTLTINPAPGCILNEIKVFAGYEIKGGSGGVHAPRKAQNLWYTQDEIYVQSIDDRHYRFVLPEDFYDDLAPGYLENTKFRVESTFKCVSPTVMWCQESNTLYFAYDEQPTRELKAGDTWNGETITQLWVGDIISKTAWASPGWSSSSEVKTGAKKVVFDEGFAKLRPTSCYKWFTTLSEVTEIEGIENLNTSEVTNMNSMFFACTSLKLLDLSGFDVSKVTNATAMFRACSSLETIWCDQSWDIATSAGMFEGDTNLVGAVRYQTGNTDCAMANPVSGYFTASLPITLLVSGDGSADVPESGFPGESVKFTITPNPYGSVTGVSVTGNVSGDNVEYTLAGGVYSFTMPKEAVTVTVTVTTPEKSADVLWCEGNSTLYFVYQQPQVLASGEWDGQAITDSWIGAAVTDVGWSVPGWKTVREDATRVIFDESFADVSPKSCYSWFYLFNNLISVEGLEYLNTSEVTNMNGMFQGCEKITTLDLNSFDVSKVTNATNMFRTCRLLTTIYCDNSWSIATAGGMFHICQNLVGAVPFDDSMTTSTMANPKTGYFTGKWDLILASAFEHGSVTCEKNWGYTNEVVTLTVTPDDGYVLETITVQTEDDEQSSGAPRLAPRRVSVDVVASETPGTYTFTMPASKVSVNATFVEDPLTGIDAIHADTEDGGLWYTLDGRLLNGKPSAPGIYLHGKSKVLVR